MSIDGALTQYGDTAIAISRIQKSFAGVTVLNVEGLDIRYGEVFGLIGENGAGKSTLVKTLAGIYTPDGGSQCAIGGHAVPFPISSPNKHGMAFIHQDLAVFDEMTIAENIGVGSNYDAKALGIYRRNREIKIARSLLQRFGVHLDPRMLCGGLSSAERSLVAILRALRQLEEYDGRSILVLDEPTAALSRSESERLLIMVRRLAATGIAVIFIGHRMNEILTVCDRVGVLRSGSLVGTVTASETNATELVSMMLGFKLDDFYPAKTSDSDGARALTVAGISGRVVQDLSFTVSEGEIVGATGLMGMGQDELPYLLLGSAHRTSGEVEVAGHSVKPSSVTASLKAGIAVVPANRHRDSIWATGTAAENLTISSVGRFFRRGLLRRRLEHQTAGREMVRFGVRPLRPSMPLAGFSGGNQQKVVLARWMTAKPKVLVLHEPTQGVDAGAKREVFELVRQAAAAGTAVLIVSSDIEEVAHVCHRVLVLTHGQVNAVLEGDSVTEEMIALATQQPSAMGVAS